MDINTCIRPFSTANWRSLAAQKVFKKNVSFLSVIVLATLACLPFGHALFWVSDEGVLLHGAERMLHGHRLYGDFFEFLAPGGFVLTAVWFGLTGISFISARVLAILTIIGISAFSYLASWRVSRSGPLAAVFAIWWVVVS